MKIGLTLAGGGVKGAAHIGAIKALQENNIEISAVAGTSIGSIVASLLAMSYTTEEMLKLFKYFSKGLLKTDPKYLIYNIRSTKSIFGSGMVSGVAIEEAMQECARLKNIKNIQDLKMPIAIPTVDIKTGRKIVFTNRKLDNEQYEVKALNSKNQNLDIKEDYNVEYAKEYIAVSNKENEGYITNIEIGKAVRASCSYPGIFAPFTYKEYRFVDGGILDNVPTDEASKLGVDKILTIKFPPKEMESPRTAINVLSRCMDIIFHERDTRTTKKSDYVLNIDVTASSAFDIKKIDECYNAGYTKTVQEINKIRSAISLGK